MISRLLHRIPQLAFVWFLPLLAWSLAAQPTLQITSPASGTVVNPGQTLRVTVNASGATFTGMFIMAEGALDQGALEAATEVSGPPPYEFSIQVPPKISPRRYRITALGVIGPGQGVQSPAIDIVVERSSAPASFKIEPSVLNLWIGETAPLRVIGRYSDGSETDISQSTQTTYSSSLTSVATVSADGRVTAVGPGSARIVVNGDWRIPVTVPKPITITPTQLTLFSSQTQQFTARVRISSNQSATWSITPAGLGDITDTGLYTAPASVSSQQQVMVTATSVADKAISASANVFLPPVSVGVAPGLVTLTARQTQQFTATVTNATDTGVRWSLIPGGLGTVDGNGLYTAPSPISAAQTVTLKATSIADPAKSATAAINLRKSK